MKTKFIVAVVCEIQKGEDAALTTLVQLRLAHPSAYFIKPFIYGRNCSLCDFAAFCLSSQTLSELWMAKIKTYLYVSINFVYRIFFFGTSAPFIFHLGSKRNATWWREWSWEIPIESKNCGDDIDIRGATQKFYICELLSLSE